LEKEKEKDLFLFSEFGPVQQKPASAPLSPSARGPSFPPRDRMGRTQQPPLAQLSRPRACLLCTVANIVGPHVRRLLPSHDNVGFLPISTDLIPSLQSSPFHL
jgi:hypothetical protein